MATGLIDPLQHLKRLSVAIQVDMHFGTMLKIFQLVTISYTGVNPGGGWGEGPFWVGGWPVQIFPPPPSFFEDKITLNLTFIVKKLTCLTVKLLKTPKIARSLRSLAHKCILRLDLCGFASTGIIFLTSFCKERCRIKQTLYNSMAVMARKSIAGLPIIQVKGTWRSQGGIILAQNSPMTKEWNSPLKYCSFLCAQSLVHIKQYFWNLIYKMYFILPVWCKQC